MNNSFFNLLSLSMRAGKLRYGLETVRSAIIKNQVFLLLTTKDLSYKTIKEVSYLADRFSLPHLKLDADMDQIDFAIGKRSGVLAVTEEGFSKKLAEICNEMEEI